jgi:hypothetical protein
MKRACFVFLAVFMVFWGCVKTEDNIWDIRQDLSPDPVYEPEVQTDFDWLADTDMVLDPDVPVDGDVPVDSDAFDGLLDPDSPIDTLDMDLSPDIPVEPELDTGPCIPLEGGTCNLISNCNCGAGQQCRLYIDPADPCGIIEQCAATSGTLPRGSVCDPASDQCAPGTSCTTDSMSGSSTCTEWCVSDLDCSMGTCTLPILISIPSCADISLSYSACEI